MSIVNSPKPSTIGTGTAVSPSILTYITPVIPSSSAPVKTNAIVTGLKYSYVSLRITSNEVLFCFTLNTVELISSL